MPRGLSVRRGTAEDEHATFDVMRRTMNADMNWNSHGSTRHHIRNSRDCSFWVAEEAPRFGSPRIIGYARSIVRESMWSLTEFFVLPSQHRQGVGGTLLSNCIKDGDAAGASARLVLASHHPDADSLYIRRAGCIPRLPMMLLAGPSSTLQPPHNAPGRILDMTNGGMFQESYTNNRPADIIAEPIVPSVALFDEINALDREVVGYARPEEHRLWITEMGGPNGAGRTFRAVSRDGSPGELLGYSYMGAVCNGPSLSIDPLMLPHLFHHVSQLCRSKYFGISDPGSALAPVSDQYCALAGCNEVMLTWLLSCGWQIVFQYLYMSSRPPGLLDRYVCHNPLYFL